MIDIKKRIFLYHMESVPLFENQITLYLNFDLSEARTWGPFC